MRNKIEKGVDLNLRQFIKSLGYIAGGTAHPGCLPAHPKNLKKSATRKPGSL